MGTVVGDFVHLAPDAVVGELSVCGGYDGHPVVETTLFSQGGRVLKS